MKKTIFIISFITLLFAQNTDLDDRQRSADYYLYKTYKATLDRLTVDNHPQDQTTPPIQYYLMREDKTDITLVQSGVKGDRDLIVSSGHGFTASGERILIFENNLYIQTEVTAVTADTITIATPLANTFTTSAMVIRGSIDLNIDADTTSQVFALNFRNWTLPIDFQTVRITMNHSLAGDDGKFGGISELTKGLLFRKCNSISFNLGNYQSNGNLKEFGAVVEYDSKGPGGTESTTVTFDVKDIYGVVIRVDPEEPDTIKAFAQDDLSDLIKLRISFMGQVTEGE
jgi:hypothetical protein